MKHTISIREMAYEALLAVEKDGRQSHLVLEGEDSPDAGDASGLHGQDPDTALSAQDRAFLRRLIRGTLEYRLQLDYVIDCFAKTKTKNMRPGIREILRMAVYQIFYMDSVPDRAAVDEAVKLAVKKGFGPLRGFVNGVLRTIVREKETIPWPDPEHDPVRAVSVRYSVPEETVREWAGRYGMEKTEAVCAAFLEDRLLSVHVFSTGKDRSKEYLAASAEDGPEDLPASAEENECLRPSGILPGAFFLKKGTDPARLPAFRDGLLYVQDLSSQIAVAAAGIEESDRVLDLCAAPGGKSLLAAEQAREGTLLARDLTETKTALIRENAVRCHMDNLHVETADAVVFDPALEGRFDVVIADLPCSGFGVAGKKPEIKYKPYRETVTALAQLQRRILENAVRYVRPCGKLLYSTCTIAAEENEENVRWLKEQYPLKLQEPAEPVKSLLETRGIPCDGDGVQLLPCDGPWDGFFFALFMKKWRNL